MSARTFNLLDTPWIAVRYLDGATAEVGLLEVFRKAHTIAALDGDMATQDVAIERLLIAVLRRALHDSAEDVDDLEGYWGQLHASEMLPYEQVGDYLERFRDRFDLCSRDQPFMQVAGDTTSKRSGLQKLIADLPDTADKQLFTTRAGRGASRLELPEAARWLIHTHAFDPSGIKTGLVGDSRVKGGKGYPIGLGWSGNCGLLLARGATLKESLLLNLVLTNLSSDDLPTWEVAQDGPGVRVGSRGAPARPVGPTQAMTWQSRRVILHFDEEFQGVIDVTIGNGDPVPPQNQWGIEDHTAWRYSANQSKKGSDVYFPATVDPERRFWRGISGVLAVDPTRGRVKSKAPAQHAPGLVTWLAQLVQAGALPKARFVPLAITGAVYGTQNSMIDTTVSDELVLPAAVLEDVRLKHVAVNGVSDAEAAVIGLRGLARDLCRAAGINDTDGAADDASRRAYATLERRYRVWLQSLGVDLDLDALEQAWQRQVREAVHLIATELVRDAGSAALVGRAVKRMNSDAVDHLDVGSAWGRFGWALQRALPNLGNGSSGSKTLSGGA
ncbi:type I-E CRISPR-associated protein Cse1/CasA [Dermacoccus abyssi]